MVLDNVSWGEIFILVGVGISFIGRKDLPVASKHVGRQVGRVVGLLVGGRQRLDMYTANNELSKLQNELRMGLRELDAIKTEMAVASSVGMRQLGSTVGTTKARREQPTIILQQPNYQTVSSSASNSTTTSISDAAISENTRSFSLPPTNSSTQYTSSVYSVQQPTSTAASSSETDRNSTALAMRAIAEDEWNKRGIGFKSRAEQGTTFKTSSTITTTTTNSTLPDLLRHHATIPLSGGAAILAELIQNNLIYDQYDRITQEQEQILRPNRTKSEEADEKTLKSDR
jgi:hypothetical protein